jgi:predicted enzyme related to lactoylglutathione lyase
VTSIGCANFSFTKLVVRDLDRMGDFYGRLLGTNDAQRLQAKIDGDVIDEIIIGIDGQPGLILMSGLAGSEPNATGVVLGFTTTGIAELFERAQASGGKVRRAPRAVAEAGGLLVGLLDDPEGHTLEVVEVPS